ncbi:hypothetical protein [Verrucomicrobium spinosum]|uniref:hypothetical protein n=1 Tax=Verrucomicrobium spinosum TaxID=2736 RepID=UPI000174443E|nr:hypothetical protein [Verrucomicrobium spinosum]
MYDSSPATAPSLRVLEIQNGLVISESGQQDADDFAADYQGLRHFADRVGGALELGGSLYAAIHEPEFSMMFLLPVGADKPATQAVGAMVDANVSNNELLVTLRQQGV